MRPGEGQADDRDGEAQREEEMPEREPPAGENEPDDVAKRAKRTGAEILVAGISGARYRPLTERLEL